jgi:hypothetical protein
MIFQLSRSRAGSNARRVGFFESLRWNHCRATQRLEANEIAAPTKLPAKTMSSPHQSPKKKPPPTASTPPGSKRILQTAKSSG